MSSSLCLFKGLCYQAEFLKPRILVSEFPRFSNASDILFVDNSRVIFCSSSTSLFFPSFVKFSFYCSAALHASTDTASLCNRDFFLMAPNLLGLTKSDTRLEVLNIPSQIRANHLPFPMYFFFRKAFVSRPRITRVMSSRVHARCFLGAAAQNT